MESMEPEIALPAGESATPRVVFSELIDGWLREGERLHESAAEGDGQPTGAVVSAPADGWRARTAELWRRSSSGTGSRRWSRSACCR